MPIAPPLGFEGTAGCKSLPIFGTPGAEAVGYRRWRSTALAMICRPRALASPGTNPGDNRSRPGNGPCLFARQQGAEVIEIPIYDPACNYLPPDAPRP